MTSKTIYILSNDLVYFDSSYLTDEQLQKAKVVEVEELPHREGYTTVLKLNYDEGNAQYVYEKLPETEIEQLRFEIARNNAEMFDAVLALIGGM